MMILRSSPPSPFGRKVKIAAKMTGLYDKIELVNAQTTDPQDSLRDQNPLGKIPVLIMEDGEAIYDSFVILDSLDVMSGGKLIPQGEKDRRQALTLHALADGITEASLLIVYEKRMRDASEQSESWMTYQAEKVERGLSYLEANCPSLDQGIHIGHIAVAACLGYRDLRFSADWRESYPTLAKWLEEFAAKVPAYEQTHFAG